MKIKHRLTFNLIFSAAAMLVILTSQYFLQRQVDLALQKSAVAGNITANGVTGLGSVTMDYVLNQQARAVQQWQQRHVSLGALLATSIYDRDEELRILERLRTRHSYLGEIFPRLIQLHTQEGSARAPTALQRELRARLVTQVMVATQDMVTDANSLLRLANAELRRVHRATDLIVALLAGAMVLIVLLTMLFVVRDVLEPVSALQQGAEIVGAGDLSYRTNIRLENEIGALSRAFDAMTAKLARTQAELNANTLQLRETIKELEAFSYSVSHDLRSPLRGIDGWSLALQEDYGPVLDDKGREYLATVRAEAQRMGRLIDDLLQLSRVTRGELAREPVDLSALALSVARRCAEAYPQHRVEFAAAPDLVAKGDARMLEIVLTNLLENAWKFSVKREHAQIEFGRTTVQDPVARVQVQAYFVRDNGVGFDMAHATKLFGAFQRLHAVSEFPGTGIGLATVQRIVHRHGGRIWAEAQPERGACFYFTLGEPL